MILIASKNDDVDATFYTHLELDAIVDFDNILEPDAQTKYWNPSLPHIHLMKRIKFYKMSNIGQTLQQWDILRPS